MGRMLTAAIERAALTDVAERALCGKGLSDADLLRLRNADVLVVAGLADAVRQAHRGRQVQVLSPDAARRASDLVKLDLDPGRADGPTGQDILLQIALTRLATPCALGIAVSCEQLGLQLVQTALVFGADVIIADLGSKRTLPLLDGKAAREAELRGLIERAGWAVSFDEAPDEVSQVMEQRS